MKVHHFGYAVKSIEKSLVDFEILGFIPVGESYTDVGRRVKIQFIENGPVNLELIEPIADDSPVSDVLKKNGNTIYHICYASKDIEEDIKNLKKNRFIVIEEPKEAGAIDGCRVAFLYKKGVGLFELVGDY